jgi:serine/threonine protein kinase
MGRFGAGNGDLGRTAGEKMQGLVEMGDNPGIFTSESFSIVEDISTKDGTAVVKKAELKQNRQICALKHVSWRAGKVTARVQMEIDCLRRCQSDNVVKLHGHFDQPERLSSVLVMEFVTHDDFGQYCDKMSMQEIREYAHQLLSALSVVHGSELVHCDVKPGNFPFHLGTRTGKLIDFGEAIEARSIKQGEKNMSATNGYRAPEALLRGNDQGPPMDIWAVGIVLAQLVLGVNGWNWADSTEEQLLNIWRIVGEEALDALLDRYDVLHPRFRERMPRQRTGIDFDLVVSRSFPFDLEENVKALSDLLKAMLQADPRLRPTALQLLESNFFRVSDGVDENEEELCLREALDMFMKSPHEDQGCPGTDDQMIIDLVCGLAGLEESESLPDGGREKADVLAVPMVASLISAILPHSSPRDVARYLDSKGMSWETRGKIDGNPLDWALMHLAGVVQIARNKQTFPFQLWSGGWRPGSVRSQCEQGLVRKFLECDHRSSERKARLAVPLAIYESPDRVEVRILDRDVPIEGIPETGPVEELFGASEQNPHLGVMRGLEQARAGSARSEIEVATGAARSANDVVANQGQPEVNARVGAQVRPSELGNRVELFWNSTFDGKLFSLPQPAAARPELPANDRARIEFIVHNIYYRSIFAPVITNGRGELAIWRSWILRLAPDGVMDARNPRWKWHEVKADRVVRLVEDIQKRMDRGRLRSDGQRSDE